MVGLLLNAVTLAVSVAIVIVFRIMDRDNRSLDKLKRYAASLQEEIDGIVEKSVQELKNTALDLEVNTRAGRELLSDVNREDSRLTEIQERIGGLENSVRNSETAMDQLAGLTQSVEENMRNLRRESDFVTAVAKKVKEIDERTQAIRSEMDEVLNEFEAKASDSLERISREVRDDFEEEKKECLRSIEDTKESAERDWAAYVSGEKESFDRAADEIREFVRTISGLPKMCPHFHLSLQSGCTETLKRMNRRYTAEEYFEKCELLRKYFHEPALTTDVIVGFPGETQEEFEASRAFVDKVDFYETHVFKYSRREGTKAAVMPDQVPEPVKAERSAILLELSKKKQKAYEERLLGTTQEVLIEEEIERDGEIWQVGHTREYVKAGIKSRENLVNQLVPVEIENPFQIIH